MYLIPKMDIASSRTSLEEKVLSLPFDSQRLPVRDILQIPLEDKNDIEAPRKNSSFSTPLRDGVLLQQQEI